MRNTSWSLARRLGFLAVATVWISSCDNVSKVGKQPEPQPQAVVSALGQGYTNDASGNLTTTIRAGSDLVLSAKNSLKSADDTGLPLMSFEFEQASSDTATVQLIRRTTNSVSFTAPEVTQDTTLHFKLTVKNAKGASATADAQVLVKPVRDVDHFLQYFDADNVFPVVITTPQQVIRNPSALPTDTYPVAVKVTKLVTFYDRDDPSHTTPHTRVPVGKPVTTPASWSQLVGTSSSCTGAENPKLQLTIPRVNMDDLLGAPIAGFPDGVILSDVLETADVDSIKLEVQIDLVPANPAVTSQNLGICIGTATTASASGIVVDTESLYAANIHRDSRASAIAYFNKIDPNNTKLTLDSWLDANGFDHTVDGYKADAHAVYTNNFDLGFGRNMYMKYGACDTGFAQLPLQQRIGHCDVAAVVINYIDVEASVKRLNPVIAVAMEYSASPGTTARYTKFYAFTPDTRTGVYRRVLSVNLDRRGEEYMPQSCVVCHGGTPGTATSYASSADIGATFIPWDLDSFLYSDTDTGFSNKPVNDALKAQYTRAAQQGELKKLNVGAYLTYADPAAIPGRTALARDLVESWYGGAGLPNATYDDSGTPDAWKPGGNFNNPADSGTFYHDVFARHCRGCHILQVPNLGDPRTAVVTAPVSNAPINACDSNSSIANLTVRVGSTTDHQLPMGCYWEFAHAPNLVTRLSAGMMPFARRTTDRLWVADNGGQSAGQKLLTHLSTQGVTITVPGTPAACIDTFGTPITGQSAVSITRNQWVQLGSSCSHNLSGLRWMISTPTGSTASLVGSDTASPSFKADKQGSYNIALTDATGLTTASVVARVAVVVPQVSSFTQNIVLDANTGVGTVAVDVMANGATSLDPLQSITVDSASGVTASAASVTTTSATLNITASSLTGGTVTYHLTDADGDQSAVGTITVTVVASLSAGSPTLSVATNGTLPINLGNFVTGAPNQPLTYSIVTQPSKRKRDTRGNIVAGLTAGSVTDPDGAGNVVYTAPTAVATRIRSGSVYVTMNPVNGADPQRDAFSYQACYALQPTTCATGTISIDMDSTTDFGAIVQILGDKCSLCHATNPPTGGLANDVNPNYMISPTATYNTSPLRKQFYCLLSNNAAVNEGAVSSSNYVNVVTPGSSYIYLKPQDSPLLAVVHGGGDRRTQIPALTNGDLATVLSWITDGAYFTEGSDQVCP